MTTGRKLSYIDGMMTRILHCRVSAGPGGALGYLFADAPFPHVGIGSHQEIIDLSTAEQLLPEDQIGVALMLIPRVMFAEAGITADTPLEEAAPLLLMAMSGDAELMAGLKWREL